MGKQETLIEDLAAAAEVMGQEVRPAGLLAMSDELMAYPLELSRAALIRVRRECRRLTLADILERIETADGRPLADEAWATAILAMEESETFIWTLETQQAFAVARPLVEINDRVGARMAFRDAYARLVQAARAHHVPVTWSPSLGWDVERRREVLEIAVANGRLPATHAQGLLPGPDRASAAQAVKALTLAASDGVVVGDRDNAERAVAMHALARMLDMVGSKRR
ncbi:MAG: hypothetical protein ACYCZJ_10090 [Sulfuriferula sp.]